MVTFWRGVAVMMADEIDRVSRDVTSVLPWHYPDGIGLLVRMELVDPLSDDYTLDPLSPMHTRVDSAGVHYRVTRLKHIELTTLLNLARPYGKSIQQSP